MNCAAVQAVLTHSRSANAARMVLLVLASHSNERGHIGALPIAQLCAEANASERTVKYAIRELRDELKELATEREGAGRGRTFDFDISPLLEKVQNLHASDKHADLAPIKEKGAEVAPIPPEKGANNVEKDADIAPLSDAKGADFTGTKVAPLSAKNTSTETEANASGAKRGAGVQGYVGRLLQFRRKDLRVKTLPVEQGEAAAAKWMHSQGWPLGSVGWCYRALKRQNWRGTPVTLITVKTHYPDWKQGKLNDGKRTDTQPRAQYGGRPPVTRDFTKYPSRT